jgi:hypothetical protein
MAITFPDTTALQWDDLGNKIQQAGYQIVQADGVWIAYGPSTMTQAQIDAAVQTIINGYIILPYAKKTGIKQVNAAKTANYYTLYTPAFTAIDPNIEAEFQDNFGNAIDAMLDLWASVNASAKTATTAWQKVLNTRSAAKTAITSIKAVTDQGTAAATMAAVQSIVNGIVWPA